MTRERYVLLGLAAPRADWFRTVSHWATSAMLPAEFVRCVSSEELRARLGSGRPHSAAIVDGSLAAVDRDLIAAASEAAVAVLVVDDDQRRDWRALGAAAVLASRHSRDELLEVLAATSSMIGGATVADAVTTAPAAATRRGELIVVTGPGGTGASTAAIAMAQGLATGAGTTAAPERHPAGLAARTVLLADLCRVADQAMLHDSRVVVPSLQEVVEAHRTAAPAGDALIGQTFDVPARGYRLLLGLRRPRHWVALRPRALEATLESLRTVADVVVADVESDLEGEAESGSVDVEERNLPARAAMTRAALVVVVGEASMKGSYALVRTVNDVAAFGVPGDRILPVINQAPRRPRQRAEFTTTLAELLAGGPVGTRSSVPPIFLPRRPTDQALRDGVPLPEPLPRLLARAALAVLERADGRTESPDDPPRRIAPGSLTGFGGQGLGRP